MVIDSDPIPALPMTPPAIHPYDESSDADDLDIESTCHSQETSPFLGGLSPGDTADESATCAFTDYHLILNGKFFLSISSALYNFIN